MKKFFNYCIEYEDAERRERGVLLVSSLDEARGDVREMILKNLLYKGEKIVSVKETLICGEAIQLEFFTLPREKKRIVLFSVEPA